MSSVTAEASNVETTTSSSYAHGRKFTAHRDETQQTQHETHLKSPGTLTLASRRNIRVKFRGTWQSEQGTWDGHAPRYDEQVAIDVAAVITRVRHGSARQIGARSVPDNNQAQFFLGAGVVVDSRPRCTVRDW